MTTPRHASVPYDDCGPDDLPPGINAPMPWPRHLHLGAERFYFNTESAQYQADASDLGITPGQWPDAIHVRFEGRINERTFLKTCTTDDYVRYAAVAGWPAHMVVYND